MRHERKFPLEARDVTYVVYGFDDVLATNSREEAQNLVSTLHHDQKPYRCFEADPLDNTYFDVTADFCPDTTELDEFYPVQNRAASASDREYQAGREA